MTGRIDPGVGIKLALFLRHSGKTREAIAATEFIEDRDVTRWLSQQTLAILATERGAALADLYEQERGGAALERARYWGGRAFAVLFAVLADRHEAGLVLQRIRAIG